MPSYHREHVMEYHERRCDHFFSKHEEVTPFWTREDSVDCSSSDIHPCSFMGLDWSAEDAQRLFWCAFGSFFSTLYGVGACVSFWRTNVIKMWQDKRACGWLLSLEMIKLPGYKVMLLLTKSSQFFSCIKQWESMYLECSTISLHFGWTENHKEVFCFVFSVTCAPSGKPKRNLKAHLYPYLCWSPSITRVFWTLCSCWFHSKAYQDTPEFTWRHTTPFALWECSHGTC